MYLNICISFLKKHIKLRQNVFVKTTVCSRIFGQLWRGILWILLVRNFLSDFHEIFAIFFSEFSLLWMVILWILQLCWKHRISLFVRCGLGIFSLCLLTEPKWAWRQLSQNLMRCPSRSKRGDSNTDVNWDLP